MSLGPTFPPAEDMDVAGTQLGAITVTSSGRFLERSQMNCTPAAPATLASSCGSVTTAVTPRGTIAAANCAGTQRLLSMCTWASINPGATYAPARSIT